MSRVSHSRHRRFGWAGALVVLATGLATTPAHASATGEWAAVAAAVAEFPEGTADSDLPVGVGWGTPHHLDTKPTLGDGTEQARLYPVLLQGGTLLDSGVEISRVDFGYSSACGLAEGVVYCWGDNQFGQLGDGNAGPTVYSKEPVKVGGLLANKQVTAISVDGLSACALASGKVYCWGKNSHGQLGTNDFVDSDLPKAVYAGGALQGKFVTTVSVGWDSVCVIASGDMLCWGENDSYQLGDGTNVDRPQAVAISETPWGRTPVTAVEAGGETTCAIAAGLLYCWGANDYSGAGVGSAEYDIKKPTLVQGALAGMTVKSVSAGGVVGCAIAGPGIERRAFCWGDNFEGQVGDNTSGSIRPVPVAVNTQAYGNRQVESIAVSGYGGCLLAAGQGYCWGLRVGGRIGDGSSGWTSALSPTPVDTTGELSNRRLLSIGVQASHTMGVAVKRPVFTDVSANHPFVDDIGWLAGSGFAQGTSGAFKPADSISRQAMAAFIFRYRNPGIGIPVCVGNDRKFTDVPKANPFCGAIEWMVDAGITPDSDTFKPGVNATRGVVAEWIYRSHLQGAGAYGCVDGVFADIVNDPNCGSIVWLAKAGVAGGFDANNFQPNSPISRQAIAAFLHRLGEFQSR